MNDNRSRGRRGGRPSAPPRRAPPPAATGQEARFIAATQERGTEINVQLRDGQSVRGQVEYFDRDMIKIVPASGPSVFIRKQQIRLIEEY